MKKELASVNLSFCLKLQQIKSNISRRQNDNESGSKWNRKMDKQMRKIKQKLVL